MFVNQQPEALSPLLALRWHSPTLVEGFTSFLLFDLMWLCLLLYLETLYYFSVTNMQHANAITANLHNLNVFLGKYHCKFTMLRTLSHSAKGWLGVALTCMFLCRLWLRLCSIPYFYTDYSLFSSLISSETSHNSLY